MIGGASFDMVDLVRSDCKQNISSGELDCGFIPMKLQLLNMYYSLLADLSESD